MVGRAVPVRAASGVLADETKYTEVLQKLTRGDIFTAYGRVSSVRLGEGMKAEVAIIVP